MREVWSASASVSAFSCTQAHCKLQWQQLLVAGKVRVRVHHVVGQGVRVCLLLQPTESYWAVGNGRRLRAVQGTAALRSDHQHCAQHAGKLAPLMHLELQNNAPLALRE